MSISVISKATMDQESNDTNPIQNPGNPKSGVSSQPDGLTTSCLADPALSSLPNGFQSKVWRNSSSVYCKICAASKCNWERGKLKKYEIIQQLGTATKW